MECRTILVVEDELVIALDLQASLQRAGYHVPTIAATGVDALREVQALQPDLVLLDIRLQGSMDGIAVAEQLRARCDVPIVYLTAYADEQTRQRARGTMPYGYLVKPFDDQTLTTTVEMALARAQLDQQVKASGEWFRTALHGVGDAVIATDAQGRVTYLNPPAEALLQWTHAEAVGRPIGEVVTLVNPDTYIPAEHPIITALETQRRETIQAALLLQCPDGQYIPVVGSAAPISVEQHRLEGAVLALQDVTERLRLEQARQAAQHLQQLQVLAGGVAHDFNNLLSAILGHAQIASLDLPPHSPAHAAINPIIQTAQRAAELAYQLLAYAGKGQFLVQPINLNALVTEALGLLSSTALRDVDLKLQLAPVSLTTNADATQLRQVVLNLLINAAEALLAAQGTITVTTDMVDVTDQDRIALTSGGYLPAGPYVKLAVSDTGQGIDPALQAKIFEPFFTTKTHGRGLGLSAVQGIIHGHSGVLLLESAVGQGTTFTMILPRAMTAVSLTASVLPQPTVSANGGTLLVIDDDASVRQVTARLLKHLGCAVLTASDGASGIEVFETHQAQITGVFLDLTMPGLHGTEVYAMLRQRQPDLPIVFMSGYSQQEALERLIEAQSTWFLPKPFTLEDLQSRLQPIIEVNTTQMLMLGQG